MYMHILLYYARDMDHKLLVISVGKKNVSEKSVMGVGRFSPFFDS